MGSERTGGLPVQEMREGCYFGNSFTLPSNGVMKIALRIVSIPAVSILLLTLYVFKWMIHTYYFARYGGEFLTYDKNDQASINKIYEKLKENEPGNSNPDKENQAT